MTGDKHDPALVLPGQAQQGIGQLLFAERLDLFGAPLVADDDLAAAGDAEIAHAFRGEVRVDEFQFDVILETLVGADQCLDVTAGKFILANVGGDLHRLLHLAKQLLAACRDGVARTAGPVRLVDILRAQPAEHADDGDEQHGEDQALQAEQQAGTARDFHGVRVAGGGRRDGEC